MTSSFLSMGGYARYVWPCFGFGVVILIWNFWSARRYLNAAKLRARRNLAMAASNSR
jgi:heme exporter protein CcmD